MDSERWRPLAAIAGVIGLTIPWAYFWAVSGAGTFTGGAGPLGAYGQVAVAGGAILGAGFLLAWAADAAEADVPTSVAITGLAVLAVAPEYAVDAYYAWMAGVHPGHGHYARMAIANMTGANRLLIGLGWTAIVALGVVQARRGAIDEDAVNLRDGLLADTVHLNPGVSTEYVFLLAATLYGFLVPLWNGINAVDTIALVGLYVGYVYVVLRRDEESGGAEAGVAAYLVDRPTWRRRAVTVAFFAYAGFLIVTAVEPFANGLEHLGRRLGLPPFLVVQWIAPIASETPELLVTGYLVNKARTTDALDALVSSKLNQWTLLVGTLVVVYSIALGGYASFPLTRQQTGEIWLTAAYSLLALALLADLTISAREAFALLALLVVQFVPWIHEYWRLVALSAAYVALAVALFAARRDALLEVFALATDRRDVEDVSAVEPAD